MTTTEIETVLSIAEADEVTEHLAARLTGWDMVNGKFSRTGAEMADGSIVIELIKIGFGVPDRTFRTTIPPLRIVDVTPAVETGDVLIGETALDAPDPVIAPITTDPITAHTPTEPAVTVAFVPAVSTP